jgi:3-methylcrotonyl-CoA carboxylase alpha subunit
MGSKSAAKSLMEKAGVPLTPGYHGNNQDPAFLNQQADQIGYPVIIKAASGGGGKGMRVVNASADFVSALASCQREAINAFGDNKVLVEKYVTRPRHIEVQVFADTHGNAVYCFERDCSVQRRHQKVLEEAPAPGMTLERRKSMGEAAVNAAKAVGYVGAGTVEFIADQTGTFFFMEMNTRLQVEHPVTEMIVDQDLVEWQLRVAFGEPLPVRQDGLAIDGHAIEARIYAENPEGGFLPSTGILHHLHFPAHVSFVRGADKAAHARIDSGVRVQDAITPYYDPMIAKLIVWGEDRSQALARMAAALDATHVVGPHTNVAFLARCIRNPAFAAGDVHTGLIEQEHSSLLPPIAVPSNGTLLLALAKMLGDEQTLCATDRADPWAARTGWRVGGAATRSFEFGHETGPLSVHVTYPDAALGAGWLAQIGATAVPFAFEARGGSVAVSTPTERIVGEVIRSGDDLHIFLAGGVTVLQRHDPLAHAGEDAHESGNLTAPMPGRIVAVLAHPGALLEKGAPLVVMEAMKMEHTIAAPAAGTLEEVFFAVGEQVSEGAQLVRFTAAS